MKKNSWSIKEVKSIGLSQIEVISSNSSDPHIGVLLKLFLDRILGEMRSEEDTGYVTSSNSD